MDSTLLFPVSLLSVALTAIVLLPASLSVSCRKVGGLYHWRVGRLGGSLYLKRKPRCCAACDEVLRHV